MSLHFHICHSEAEIKDDMQNVMISNIPLWEPHLERCHPSIQQLILNECDKNFIYVDVSRKKFPNVKKMWLFSHPCGGGGGDHLTSKFLADDFELVVLDEYKKYFYNVDGITFISRIEAEAFKRSITYD